MTAHYLLNSTYNYNWRNGIDSCRSGWRRSLARADGEDWCTSNHNCGHRRKAQLARDAGADECIIYTQADFETETKRLTGGQGVHVVYDGVGKATFDKDLEVLRPRGYLVLFGGSSGAVPPFDLIKLSHKGSLFITRPTLAHYTATREELEWERTMCSVCQVNSTRIHKPSTSEVEHAHRDLEGRKTSGSCFLVETHSLVIFHF
jgi:NADPH2:quinone reductase